ncbi:uncharacterized protein [Montipora foliosa]|uniref:uncharacterized protein n=1 Tax=Montipora foliosa TaxID=591990 RepID=UPI0035F20543
MIFYCITCLILEALYDDLHMKKLSLDLTALRGEHCKLCKVVELANSLLSPLLFMVVGLCIPFICFALYHIVYLPEGEALAFIIFTLTWLFGSSAMLAVVMVFGSRVNDKVHSIQRFSSTWASPTSDHKKVVGVIISYFAVMLSLPSN